MRRRSRFPWNETTEGGELINLTPLLDVLFVVLILFILIAPLLELDRINLASTEETTRDKRDFNAPSPIKISVKSDNTLTLNDKTITLQSLKTHLLPLKNQSPNTIPQLYHDKNAPFGTYQSIKNQVEACGFTDLDIILKK